jgi:hypothetical protein
VKTSSKINHLPETIKIQLSSMIYLCFVKESEFFQILAAFVRVLTAWRQRKTENAHAVGRL